jgi:hypothetical protein
MYPTSIPSIAKFRIDPHFIYITVQRYENQEILQSYYKLTDVEMEHIIKDWQKTFLVHVINAELPNTDTIGRSMVM